MNWKDPCHPHTSQARGPGRAAELAGGTFQHAQPGQGEVCSKPLLGCQHPCSGVSPVPQHFRGQCSARRLTPACCTWDAVDGGTPVPEPPAGPRATPPAQHRSSALGGLMEKGRSERKREDVTLEQQCASYRRPSIFLRGIWCPAVNSMKQNGVCCSFPGHQQNVLNPTLTEHVSEQGSPGGLQQAGAHLSSHAGASLPGRQQRSDGCIKRSCCSATAAR